jgi:hypothetical protein
MIGTAIAIIALALALAFCISYVVGWHEGRRRGEGLTAEQAVWYFVRCVAWTCKESVARLSPERSCR